MTPSLSEISLYGVGIFFVWRLLNVVFRKSSIPDFKSPAASSFLFGHLKEGHGEDGWEFYRGIRDSGCVTKLKGLLGAEQLYIADPLALHHILVKDQEIYEETKMFYALNRLLFGRGLFAIWGDDHKRQRKILNPVFSMKHMRDVLPVLYPIAHQLRDGLLAETRGNPEYIDVMAWMGRAALEYIGQGGLGHSFSTLDKDKTGDVYANAIKQVLPLITRVFMFTSLLPYIEMLNRGTRRFLVSISPFRLPKDIRDLTDTLEGVSTEILEKKRSALEKGGDAFEGLAGKGKDIMSVLLKANSSSDMTEEDLIGHMNTFIFAATDTTTSALSRILSLLAEHLDIQSKLREEVTAARKEHGDLDYDTLQALPYLDAVCRETLRAYPPVAGILRRATQDTILPLLYPVTLADGKTVINEIPVAGGTEISVSLLGANRCKKIWGEDAEEWKPSRWFEPLPESAVKAHLSGVYSQMMTFSAGGRACIGFKFSEMEMKMVLSILIESLIFEPGLEVSWNIGSVIVPRVKGTGEVFPRLPMKVRPVIV
ncbi:cytochrome P450 [Pyrrhoderma noxium]|uniref:Cytochrome P450 n=1 Tax=Pyrrhoderma noxium TaxID=2282107 RepID=A0A286UC60_9AGAM|nr:cytochrome P450 [Pyrrhoderma noxium]